MMSLAYAMVDPKCLPRPDHRRAPLAVAPGHRPVLLAEAMEVLDPGRGGVFVDGTFGAGGHSLALVEEGADRVIAIDRDPDAVRRGRARLAESGAPVALHLKRFARLSEVLAEENVSTVDGVILDLGLSSMQLDDENRGFSFRFQGPLDMRMSGSGVTAADLVNGLDEKRLARLFTEFGEEPASRRIARAICAERERDEIRDTSELAEIVAAAVTTRRPGRIHPATRVFQALRIAVNDELAQLASALAAAEAALAPGGVLCVISFHSLEDRIVKRFFNRRAQTGAGGNRHLPEIKQPAATFECPRRRAIVPSPEEVAENPRARSARLRWGRRTFALASEEPVETGPTPILPCAGDG